MERDRRERSGREDGTVDGNFHWEGRVPTGQCIHYTSSLHKRSNNLALHRRSSQPSTNKTEETILTRTWSHEAAAIAHLQRSTSPTNRLEGYST